MDACHSTSCLTNQDTQENSYCKSVVKFLHLFCCLKRDIYISVYGGGIGKGPCTKFISNVSDLMLIQGRTTGGWSKPERWLKERARICKVSVLVFNIHLGTWPCNLFPYRSNHSNLSWYLRKYGNSHKLQDPNPRTLNCGRVAFIIRDSVRNSNLLLDR